jgi:hypothetical protein
MLSTRQDPDGSNNEPEDSGSTCRIPLLRMNISGFRTTKCDIIGGFGNLERTSNDFNMVKSKPTPKSSESEQCVNSLLTQQDVL